MINFDGLRYPVRLGWVLHVTGRFTAKQTSSLSKAEVFKIYAEGKIRLRKDPRYSTSL